MLMYLNVQYCNNFSPNLIDLVESQKRSHKKILRVEWDIDKHYKMYCEMLRNGTVRKILKKKS